MNEIPRIKFEIEFAAERIIHSLAVHQDDIKKQVEEGVRMAVNQAPEYITLQTKSIIQESIKESVNSYFRYGKGRDAIDKIVEGAFEAIVTTTQKRVKKANSESRQ